MPKGIYPRRVKRHAVTQPLDKSYRLIPLTQGQNAIVDTEDYEWLNSFFWSAHSYRGRFFYAMRNGRIGEPRMHRLIMGVSDPSIDVDHENHNGLDNRKKNLRICENGENARNCRVYSSNTSGYKGVSRNSRGWMSRIQVDKERIHLGTFSTPESAARAYNAAATVFHGEFCYLNQL